MESYLPEVNIPPPPEEVEYEPTPDKDPTEPETYNLKQKLDTDKVFKKKLVRAATIPKKKLEINIIQDEIEETEEMPVLERRGETDEEEEEELTELESEIIAEEEYTQQIEKEEREVIKQTMPMKTKPKKKKKVLTQSQLDALSRGRATSLKNRQAKKKIKDKEKNQVVFVGEDDDYKVPEKAMIHHRKVHPSPVSKDDIRNIMVSAISQYDDERKEKKKAKKEREKKELQDSRLTQQINRALNPSDPDYYNECFTFT
tara:strand:+ start:2678 stop:3451 length:774 start_codon:yes stop_codon:yes gene_type:complete